MRILTGVSAVLSAAHRDRNGNMHGHTWQITAWWDAEPDAVQKQKELKEYLTIFDHHVLSDGVAWGEHLGKAILHGMKCVKVEVNRPLEGIYAVVEWPA